MKYSREIKESKKLCDDIARDISRHIYDFIFKETLEIIKTSFGGEMLNALSNSSNIKLILREINSGNIYVDSRGNAKIKKSDARIVKALKSINAKWNPSTRGYKIDLRAYPDILQVQVVKTEQAIQNMKRLDGLLALKKRQIQEEEAWNIPEEKVDAVVSDLMEKSLVAIPEKKEDGKADLGIVKKVDESTLQQFKEEYLEDTLYPIKNMESRAVERLRKRLLKLTMEEGLRQEDIAEVLMKEFGESERHAMFLARQEAKLIKAKIAKDRALNLGYTDYIWQTHIDTRTRKLHRELNGRRCSFLSPPIIDEIGTRGNPGEAFGCRCIARIIVDE